MGTGAKDVRDLTTKREVPGPGNYKQTLQRTQIGAAIGSAERFVYPDNKVPGPGSYRQPPMIA